MSKGSFTYGGQANVNMQEIAFSIYTAVDSAFYDVEYPEHDWYKVVKEDQVLSDINAGATNYAFITRDRQGAAAFRGQAQNNNIPMVSQTAGAVTVPLCASNVGAKIDNEDGRQYQMGFNGNLAQDLGECMRFACDNLVERTVFFGDDSVGFKGFMNYPGVTISSAANGAAGSPEWSKKTAAEMVKDITDGLATVWSNSRGVFLPNTVFLPLEQFNLLAKRSVLDNVMLPLMYRGLSMEERVRRAREMLKRVGLENFETYLPTQLSGGMKQRVAIARALAGDPKLILADEPTGALDSKMGNEILTFFKKLNKEMGITIVMITHEFDIARYSDRLIHIYDGRITYDGKVPKDERSLQQ